MNTAMKKISLSNLKLLTVSDEDKESYYGCSQQWYGTEKQRLCGCGPSVACGIVWYLSHYLGLSQQGFLTSKDACLKLMEEVWKFMTPSTEGIPSTTIFYENVLAYANARGLKLEPRFCDIPSNEFVRPDLKKVVNFIEGGLRQNSPIAFLNLCNGEEDNLEEWHWVTIVSLEWSGRGERALVDIYDMGLIKKTDLSLWYKTTTLGGGFVYFTPVNKISKQHPQKQICD